MYRYFSKPANLSLLNGGLIALMVFLNLIYQAFCIPTTWAIIVLFICFTNTIFYPFLEKTKLGYLSSFINGISLFVFLYCVLFLEQMNYLGIIMTVIGVGFAVYIPHFFVVQIIWKNLISPINKTSKHLFISAIILCSGTVIFIGQEYKNAIVLIETFEKNNFTHLDKTFMTEKILGMHFIYHTRFCEFDGWRPPKHEPILVIGMWLNNRYDPLDLELETRLEMYKKFFPDKKHKFDCSCAIKYRQHYHNDKLWSLN